MHLKAVPVQLGTSVAAQVGGVGNVRVGTAGWGWEVPHEVPATSPVHFFSSSWHHWRSPIFDPTTAAATIATFMVPR
jgi:hypothetical protein